MKEIIVIISFVILIIGIIINYNIQALRTGTNLIVVGFMGVLLVGLYDAKNKNAMDNAAK